jgi:hypothetical protein
MPSPTWFSTCPFSQPDAGVQATGIYDNMKTAVETIFAGKDRLYNRRFLEMCSHYLESPTHFACACPRRPYSIGPNHNIGHRTWEVTGYEMTRHGGEVRGCSRTLIGQMLDTARY